ncbi:MAG: P-loop NTPase [Spirochaetales bacterium]|nr:P-loop NTPase [Spirochaetales bacterium]
MEGATMVRIVPVASGKGGVGKTVLAANLAVALARLGRVTVLVDLDLGASNLHTCLGIKSSSTGLGALAWRQERSFDALVMETPVPRLHFVPGDGLLPGTANLDHSIKRKILKGIASLPADFAILDLGAGSSHNVVDFFLASSRGLLVARPETTSVLNAYSFLKTTVWRLLFRAFPRGGQERARLAEFAARRLEGSGSSFLDLADLLAREFSDSAAAALGELRSFVPRVVLNQGRSRADVELGSRIRAIAGRNLGIGVEYAAFLPEDASVPHSIAEREPLVLTRPEAPYSLAVADLAARMAAEGPDSPPRLALDDEDLASLAAAALAAGADPAEGS